MNDPYASVAQNYDIMIDWPARLARERVFFTQLLQEHPVRRLLDVGCGTGHHSRMFAELGIDVTGIDPSKAMLEQARLLTSGDNPTFRDGGFYSIHKLKGKFDLITVLGNTLAYAKNATDLYRILLTMRNVLQPTGRLCIQLVNYDLIMRAASYSLPLVQRQFDAQEYLFLREYRRKHARVEFSLITLVRNGTWQKFIERSLHYAITAETLQRGLIRAGFTSFKLYGSFQQEQFDPATSTNLIAVADHE